MLTVPSNDVPLVSVVVPAYNAGKTIRMALASVLSQTYSNLEVIVGDDASTDDTFIIALSIEDPRLRLVRNASRVGPGRTRDKLLRDAKGQWITFIDADDEWAPDRIETLIAATGGDLSTIVFDDILECHVAADCLTPWRRLRGPGAFGSREDAVPIATDALVDSKSLLMQPLFSADLLASAQAVHGGATYGEDTRFLLELLAKGARLTYVPRALYSYRIGHLSATTNPDRYKLLLQILEECLELFRHDEVTFTAIQRKIARTSRQEGRVAFGRYLKQGRVEAALAVARARPSLFLELFRHNAVMLGLRAHRIASRLRAWRTGGFGQGD